MTDWGALYRAGGSGRRYWPCEELVRFVARRQEAGQKPIGEPVLEVGCGNGANLWYLAEHSPCVFGIDSCLDALRMAREYCDVRNRPNVILEPGDIGAIQFHDGTFAGIVDAMTSQHVPWQDHLRIYREYRRVLLRGGWLFLYHLDAATTGACGNEYENGDPYDRNPLALFPDVGLTCCPTRIALKRTVRLAGFDIVETRGLRREYPNGSVASYTVIEAEAV